MKRRRYAPRLSLFLFSSSFVSRQAVRCSIEKGAASIEKGSLEVPFHLLFSSHDLGGQLGPALKPLILFGNLSVLGIDLRPTRGRRRVRRMCIRKVYTTKRDNVSIKLPCNSPREIMYRGHDTRDDKSRRISRAHCPPFDEYLYPSALRMITPLFLFYLYYIRTRALFSWEKD